MTIEQINSQIEELEKQKKKIKVKEIENFIKKQVEDFSEEKQFQNSAHFGNYLELFAKQIKYIMEH